MNPPVFHTQNINMGGDASASRRSAWIPLEGFRNFALEIALPSTGSPIGVISVEVCNHGVSGQAGAELPSAALTGLTQPSTGGAWACFVDNLQTSAGFVALVYTRTSGGTGAAFTDSTGTASGPILVLKE